jgi:hypothetical protein
MVQRVLELIIAISVPLEIENMTYAGTERDAQNAEIDHSEHPFTRANSVV